MFCPECGFWVRQSYAYCPGCGKQLATLGSSPISYASTTSPQSAASAANHSVLGPLQQDPGSSTAPTAAAASNPLKRPLTFKQFNVKKSEERQGLSFRASKSKSKSKANKHSHPSGAVAEDVTINIGIMVAKVDGKVDPVRGKGLPLKIKKNARSDEILQAAIKKRIDFDRSFRSDYLYRLLYPDGQEVVNLPGSNEPFSLLKYKEALGKTFARLTLYLGYNEANVIYNSDDDDATSSPLDLDDDINDFLATADSANPALNNILTTNTNAARSNVNGLLAMNIRTGINASEGSENRDELILPISGLHDR